MSGIVFDAMFGAKKLAKYIPVINCLTSAGELPHLKAQMPKLGKLDCGYNVWQLFDATHGVKNDARHGID